MGKIHAMTVSYLSLVGNNSNCEIVYFNHKQRFLIKNLSRELTQVITLENPSQKPAWKFSTYKEAISFVENCARAEFLSSIEMLH